VADLRGAVEGPLVLVWAAVTESYVCVGPAGGSSNSTPAVDDLTTELRVDKLANQDVDGVVGSLDSNALRHALAHVVEDGLGCELAGAGQSNADLRCTRSNRLEGRIANDLRDLNRRRKRPTTFVGVTTKKSITCSGWFCIGRKKSPESYVCVRPAIRNQGLPIEIESLAAQVLLCIGAHGDLEAIPGTAAAAGGLLFAALDSIKCGGDSELGCAAEDDADFSVTRVGFLAAFEGAGESGAGREEEGDEGLSGMHYGF